MPANTRNDAITPPRIERVAEEEGEALGKRSQKENQTDAREVAATRVTGRRLNRRSGATRNTSAAISACAIAA